MILFYKMNLQDLNLFHSFLHFLNIFFQILKIFLFFIFFKEKRISFYCSIQSDLKVGHLYRLRAFEGIFKIINVFEMKIYTYSENELHRIKIVYNYYA